LSHIGTSLELHIVLHFTTSKMSPDRLLVPFREQQSLVAGRDAFLGEHAAGTKRSTRPTVATPQPSPQASVVRSAPTLAAPQNREPSSPTGSRKSGKRGNVWVSVSTTPNRTMRLQSRPVRSDTKASRMAILDRSELIDVEYLERLALGTVVYELQGHLKTDVLTTAAILSATYQKIANHGYHKGAVIGQYEGGTCYLSSARTSTPDSVLSQQGSRYTSSASPSKNTERELQLSSLRYVPTRGSMRPP
jgi:hypothetical protein